MCSKTLLRWHCSSTTKVIVKSKLNVNGSILYSLKHRRVQKKKNTNEHTVLKRLYFKEMYLFKHECAVAFLLLWCSQCLKKFPLIVHSTMKSIWFPDRPSVFCWTMRHTSVCAVAAPYPPPFPAVHLFGGGGCF